MDYIILNYSFIGNPELHEMSALYHFLSVFSSILSLLVDENYYGLLKIVKNR